MINVNKLRVCVFYFLSAAILVFVRCNRRRSFIGNGNAGQQHCCLEPDRLHLSSRHK